MISSETIIVNSKFEKVFVLSYYDGIKEEVDLESKTIYLWYDYSSDIFGEYWLEIVPNAEQIFIDYLSNQIGIKELIDNSIIFICTRLYEKYSEIKRIQKVENFEEINLPENEWLGYDFLSKFREIMVQRIKYNESPMKIFKKSKNSFSQSIETDMKLFKEIKTNIVQNEYLYPIAA